jgi:hypothetical protein
MRTQCTASQMEFQGIGRRVVKAEFDGGHITSDAGVLALRELDEKLDLCRRVAECFTDHRNQDLIEHSVEELVRERVMAMALGYEDLNDHDDLARDPVLALAAGKVDVEGKNRKRARDQGRPLASKSTLNRLELTPETLDPNNRYWKITHCTEKIEDFFVRVFLESFANPPDEIILDFDATDDPLHGEQEGRFFHGYYNDYCYLPLYVFCEDRLLVAKLRTSGRDAGDGSVAELSRLVKRIRKKWCKTRIVVRADSGFAREELMKWCEQHHVYYLLGLAKNQRLVKKLGKELAEAKEFYEPTGHAARVFTQFWHSTRKSWSRYRRVIGKAEYLAKGPNPRFIVTNLPEEYAEAQELYEKVYCQRGEMENRIKEQQLDLFADRTSTRAMRSNQLRLWFSSLAYVLVSTLRRVGLKGTRLAKATCGTIRLKLFKIGALIKISVRRIMVHLAGACPYQDVFRQLWRNLQAYPLRL